MYRWSSLFYFPDQPLKTSTVYITRKSSSALPVPYIFPPNEGLTSTQGTCLLHLIYKACAVLGPLLPDLMQIACIGLDPSILFLGFLGLGPLAHMLTLWATIFQDSCFYKMSSWDFLSSMTDSMSLVPTPPWRNLSLIHTSPFLRV